MSVTPATECPSCGSSEFREFGRWEASSVSPGDPPEDVALYECESCGAEFDSSEQASS